MRIFKALLAIAFCGAMLTVTASAVSNGTPATSQGVGTVVRVVGVVSYSLGDGKWHPLIPGKYLVPGAIVRTGIDGSTDIVLGKAVELPQVGVPGRISFTVDAKVTDISSYKPYAEQNVIRLTPNTTLAIDALGIMDTGADTVCDTELDLKKGKIYASVKKESAASTYLIKIPNGIAGIRGTIFSLGDNGDLAVFESHTTGGGVTLSLTSPNGSVHTYVVGAGQQLIVSSVQEGAGGGIPQIGNKPGTGTTTGGGTTTTGGDTTTTGGGTTTTGGGGVTTGGGGVTTGGGGVTTGGGGVTTGGNVTISQIPPATITIFQQMTPAIKTIFIQTGQTTTGGNNNGNDITEKPVSQFN